ncbi:hypothetical protein Tco_1264371 [Tanacetum coccineum]
MALPEDHLAKFHKMTDAKEMWDTIKSRFGGNDESKKMQKYILKLQFEGFSISNSEGLHKGYDRTKPRVDSLSFDDLYNNLRVFENDVKGSTASSSSTQNVAFISENTSSTNDVSTAYSVFNTFGQNSQTKGNQESRRDAWNSGNKDGRRSGKQEDSKALVTIDGEGVDWTSHTEEEDYALMAWNSSSSDTEVTSCSNECKESYAKLKKLYDAQREQLSDASIEIKAYTQDLDDKTDVLTYHKKLLAEAQKEKEDLKAKVEKWHNSSKNLGKLLNTQMSANDKFGLGCSIETHESLPEPTVNEPKVVNQPKVWSDAPIIEEYELDSEDEHVSQPTKEQEQPSFASTNKQVKTLRETVKNQFTHSKNPTVDKKGLGYGFTQDILYVVDLDYLIRDCDFHEKRMAKQAELNNSMGMKSSQREIRPIWNNVQRVNHKNQFVPTTVLTRTGKILVNTARASGTNNVNTAKVNAVSAVRGKRETAVKPSVGKFDGKSDEGFLVGYSLQSKDFRVYNLDTKRVEENLHITFLENKSNVAGKGPTWLFDLDYLTDSMNYQPVRSENQANKHGGPQEANHNTGTKDNIDADENPIDKEDQVFLDELERIKRQEKNANDAAEALRKEFAQETKDLLLQTGAAKRSSTNIVNTASTPVSNDSSYDGLSFSDPTNPNQDDSEIPALKDIYKNPTDGIFTYSSYNDEGAVADFTNLEPVVNVSPIPTSRINFIHPSTLIHVDPQSAVQTRSKVTKSSGAYAFSKDTEEEAIDKTLFNKKDKHYIILIQVYVDDIIFGSTKKSWCDEFKALMKSRFQMSSMGELTFVKTASTPIETQKPLVKDEEASYVDVTPKFPIKVGLFKRIYRDAYEKKLIQVLKIHTDDNVADLLTKAFDVSRFQFLVCAKAFIHHDEFKKLMVFQESLEEIKRLYRLIETLKKEPANAILESCPKHNMVAYLEKSKGNAEFHEVIDFLARSSIYHALTVSPVVSTTFVKQFWMSAKSKIINNIRYITAKLAGKPVSISEASIRSDLLFNDADGIESLPNQAIFDAIQLMGYEGDLTVLTFNKALFSPQWRFLFHTMNHCISSKSTSWDQIPTNIVTAVICLTSNQKCNFSKLIFDGMLRHLYAKKKFVMYPRFISIFLSKQPVNVPVPLDHFPVNALTSNVFSFMVKKGKHFSGKVTPLFASMLVQSTEDEGATSERPSEPQPTPSPPHPSEANIEPQSDPSPRPLPTPHIPDSHFLGGTDQEAQEASQICYYTSQRLDEECFLEERLAIKKSLSQTDAKRVSDDDEMIWDKEDAQDVGRTRNGVNAEKEGTEDAVSTEDVVSTDKEKVSTDRSKVSTDRSKVSTDRSKDSTDKEKEGTDKEKEGTDKDKDSTVSLDEGTDDRTEARSATPTTQQPLLQCLEMMNYCSVLSTWSQASSFREKEKLVELKDESNDDLSEASWKQETLRLKSNKTFDEIQALYEKVKRFDESFTAVGSTKDKRMIKEMNEGVKDTDQKRLKEEDIVKVPAKSDDDSGDEHRKCLKIATFEGTLDNEIMEKKSVIARLDKVSSPDEVYLVIYRANGNFRAFNYLMEVLHIFDRQDLFHLYELMMEQYSEITLEGFELILWGDL